VEAEGVAASKKNAARLGAHIVFIDESGFLVIPNVCRTWAPSGETPIHRHNFRREKVSAISGVSLSPVLHRVGLYYKFHYVNIKRTQVCEFVRHLLRHLRGPVIVVWDNHGIHKGRTTRELSGRFSRVTFEYLPPYAPELNPDEGVWAMAKRDLANTSPQSRVELRRGASAAIRAIRRSPRKLRACIASSDLPSPFSF
jgi:transposase